MGKEQEERIGYVTDSVAVGIPPEKIERFDIKTGYLQTIFGDRSSRDRVELTLQEFKEKLKGGIHPTSTGVAPGDFLEIYRQLAQRCQKIYSIHLPADVSGTVNSALTAAKYLKEEEPQVDLFVYDSYQALASEAFVVEEVAELTTEGANAQEIEGLIENFHQRCFLIGMGVDLSFIKKSGRVPQAVITIIERATNVLHITPAFYVRRLKSRLDIRPLLVRTKQQGFKKIIEMSQKEGRPRKLVILHADAPDKAEQLQREFEKVWDTRFPICEVPPSIATHTGLGLVGYGQLR